MELGEKLLLARQEAGLSQRQLCGSEITRNMLSQIEHGTAKPSMTTLQYLAARLGRPVSFFLEEDAVVSVNQQVMSAARTAFDKGELDAVAEVLEDYKAPDEVYDREMRLLQVMALLFLAEKASSEERDQYAQELLDRAEQASTPYLQEELRQRSMRIRGRLRGRKLDEVCAGLPDLDEDLTLRGEYALMKGDTARAAQLLDAAEDRTDPRWNLIRGTVYLRYGELHKAVECLKRAEQRYPREAFSALEQCFRELGDFEQAYRYACKGRVIGKKESVGK